MTVAGETVACWACDAAAVATDDYPGALLVHCPECGLYFAPQPAVDDLRSIYDEEYFSGYAGEGYASEELQRRHEARLRLTVVRRWSPPPARLFEVGAAGGYFLDEARLAGYEPSGLEPAVTMARHAREVVHADVQTAFVEDVELRPRCFDVVCAWHVLEHIPNPIGTLAALRNAIHPDGHLLVEVPNVASVMARRQGPRWPFLGFPAHVAQYGPVSLQRLLERAGFAVVATETVPFYSYFRRRQAMRPRHVAGRVALSLLARVSLRGPHASKHELLRMVARSGPG